MSARGRVQVNGVTFVTPDVVDQNSADALLNRLTSSPVGPQRFRIEPEPGKSTDLVVFPSRVWSAAAWVTPA
jgi:hypothetical protein